MWGNRSSVKVALRGGLGNQLYGLAMGWVVAIETNRNLLLDGRFIPWEGSNPNRELELNQFIWDGPVSIQFKKTIKFGVKLKALRLIAAKFKEVIIPKSFLYSANVGESISNLGSLEIRANQGKTLRGYFQDIRWSEMAFEKGMPKSLRIANHSPRVAQLHSQIGNKIAVHIRLGDFLNYPDVFPIASEKYYSKSIRSFESIEQTQNTDYWVFTDDVDESLVRFPVVMAGAERVITERDLSGPESLFLMSEFSKIVISHSSFSTWAALFSSARGGQVVCPEASNGDSDDLRPTRWIRVKE